MFVLLSSNPTWLENPSHDICWCLKARGFRALNEELGPEMSQEGKRWGSFLGSYEGYIVLEVSWCTLELSKPFGFQVSFEDINVFDYWPWGNFFLLWFNFSAWSLQASTEVLKQRHQDLDQRLAVWMPFPRGGMVKRWSHWLVWPQVASILWCSWWHLTNLKESHSSIYFVRFFWIQWMFFSFKRHIYFDGLQKKTFWLQLDVSLQN